MAAGWPEALGDGRVLALESDALTCFKEDYPPSLIDFFVATPAAQHRIIGAEPASGVPWGPHIGQVLSLRGELECNICPTATYATAVQAPEAPAQST